MQEVYCLHDEIEVCFYTNLNCSVWHLVREKNPAFTHSRPYCLLRTLLCKEVVCSCM